MVRYVQPDPRDVNPFEILEALRETRCFAIDDREVVAARCIRLPMLNAVVYAEVHTYVITHVMTKRSCGSYVTPIQNLHI